RAVPPRRCDRSHLIRSPATPARPWLALRAPERRPVHEPLAHYRRAAAGTRLVGLPVNGKRSVEISAIAIYLHIQVVERRAAGVNRLIEDRTDGFEQPLYLGGPQPVGGPRPVQPGPPEGFVGVDIAHSADQ